ncbi:MAG: sulfotransferase [Thermoleophilia bacterium]|nr:sulfotransferase [Thermoleophilia bacterium]
MSLAPRNDPELAAEFAKDAADEELLATLNAALASAEESSYRDLPESYPTLHVVGVPRSGTTLLYQVLAAGLEIGYVNHLVAAFWRAPVLGLRLSRKLGLDRYRPTFDSTFGRTQGVGEPHEFGYFWNHHLRYPGLYALPPGHEETIDWARLRTVLVNMAWWNRGPLAFKPMLLVWHLERIVREMPRTCLIWIRRDLRAAALSLLEMRRSLFGSVEAWASLRPHGPRWLAEAPPWRQVAGQVVELERTIAAAAAALGPERVLEVTYEELCADPAAVCQRAAGLLRRHGYEPARHELPVRCFEPRREGSLAHEYGTRVERALEEFLSSPAIEG